MLESFFVSVTPGIGGQWQNLVGMLKPASDRMLRLRWLCWIGDLLIIFPEIENSVVFWNGFA